jgi:monoamine oxidase
MAAAIRGGVELGHAVVAIDLDDRQATIACASGRRVRANHVISSVPPSVLRRIAIEPKLPGNQAEAVAALPSQPLTQVYFAPRSRFWEQDGYAASLFTDTRAGMLAAARNRDDPTEVTSLTAWITGDNAAALDRLPPEDAGRAVLAAIETLRPSARDQLELIGMQSWGADAYAGGAWAYFRPGEVTRYAAALGRSHGRLHFCGEHLATESRGMEGAMESAEQAAAAVLGEL